MLVELRKTVFDPWLEMASYQKILHDYTAIGANAVFVGAMRDHNQGQSVDSMTLEHYPGMCEKQLKMILQNHATQNKLNDALIIHRVGLIKPGDAIVLIATWSAHRKQAFKACRGIMEDLKHKAPFWKQEHYGQTSRWVTRNTPG